MAKLINKKEEIKNRIDLINRGEVPEGYKCCWGYIYPESWNIKSLKDLFYKVKTKNAANESLPVLTNSATLGVILQDEYFDREIVNDENTNNYYIVENGDFMYNPRISSNAPAGPINRNTLGQKGIASPLYTIFRAKDTKNIEFVEKYFKSNYWHRYMKSVSNQGARHDRLNINDEDFMRMPIPQPSKQEQEKIAKILNCCDKVIALKQKLLEEYSTEKLFLLHKFFSFDSNNKVAIKNQVKFLKSRNLPKDKIIQKGKYLCIHYGQLFRVYKEQINHVISTTNFDIGYIKSRKGDVLMPTSDVTPNGLATASCININNVLIGGDILIIRPNKNILGSFLSYLINYDKKQILKLVNGVTVYHIYATDMRNFKIPIFSIEKQKQIVQILSKVDKHIKLLEQELEQYKQLKKSLSQLLLTGIVRTVEVDCEN